MDRSKPPPGWEIRDWPSGTWFVNGPCIYFSSLPKAWELYDKQTAPAVAAARAKVVGEIVTWLREKYEWPAGSDIAQEWKAAIDNLQAKWGTQGGEHE